MSGKRPPNDYSAEDDAQAGQQRYLLHASRSAELPGPMNVCILTEGGRGRGLGHVVRCRAIADAVEEAGGYVRFVVDGDDSIAAVLGVVQWELREWIPAPGRLMGLIGRDEIVLIDSLSVTQEGCDTIEGAFARTAFIDDYRRHHYRHSLVIDWTIGIERDPAYASRRQCPGVEYLLGVEYAALRKEFWDVPEKPIAAQIGTLLLTFGGSDIRNLTPAVLRAISERYPHARKSVIVGPSYGGGTSIEDAGDAQTRILRQPPTAHLVEAMLAADVAISGGGQTLYELARVGVPTVAVHLIDNQRFDLAGWEQAGAIRVAGNWDDRSLIPQVLDSVKSLESQQAREELSRAGRSVIDGGGARVIRDRLFGAGRGREQ